MTSITEHSVSLPITLPKGDVNAKMEIFYNPIMVSNRNLSILLLNMISSKNLKIADPLAGSGIRSLRFLKELKTGKIKQLCANDLKPNFSSYFTAQLKNNKIKKTEKISIENKEATQFLLEQTGFDYIDIDPFGSPNPFLAAAVTRISREGILAITATDTAALTGTYLQVTRRKYWSESMHNYLMHELGLRILIRKIQLQGTQFDKALTPLLSYHKDHYFRIYFRASKGKEKCDALIKQHQYFLFCSFCLHFTHSPFNRKTCSCGQQFQFAGPLWTGELSDSKLIQKMAKQNPFPEEQQFLDLLAQEATISQVGFYDLHEIARKLKTDSPRMENLLKKMKAVRTHFSGTGIKTTASLEEIEKEFLRAPPKVRI
ncbi:hypothetical protein HYT55_02645 [Candidatus Woesearchaeota archaeon]|nr:hypothetical protein [Candidatus Woesearchaeota archaeon]